MSTFALRRLLGLAATAMLLVMSNAIAKDHVLILGGAGNSGSAIAKMLIARGDAVTVFVRPTTDRALLAGVPVDYVVGDAMNSAEVDAALSGKSFSVIFETVQILSIDEKQSYAQMYANVVPWAKRMGTRQFLGLGSGCGDRQPLDCPLSPPVYKVAADLTRAEHILRDSGVPYTIIRVGALMPGGMAHPDANRSTGPSGETRRRPIVDDVEPHPPHFLGMVNRVVVVGPSFVCPPMRHPVSHFILGARTWNHAAQTSGVDVDRVVDAARAQDPMRFFDDLAGCVGGHLVMQDIAGDDVEVSVGEIGVFRQAPGKMHFSSEVDGPHVGIAHHGAADVDAPDLGVGKALFQSQCQLARAASGVEDAPHLAVDRRRNIAGIGEVQVVLIIAAAVKIVVAVMVEVSGEWVADVSARLHMNFVFCIGRNRHGRIQFQGARTSRVGGFHLGHVGIVVAVKLALQVFPHEVLRMQPNVIAYLQDRIIHEGHERLF